MILPLPEWTMPMSSPWRTRERMVPRRWRAWVAVIVFIRSLYCHLAATQGAESKAPNPKMRAPNSARDPANQVVGFSSCHGLSRDYALIMQKLMAGFLIFLMVGCAKLPPPSSTTSKDAESAFARLADEYIAGYLAWRPQTGTSLGF